MAKLGKLVLQVEGVGEVRFGEKDRIIAEPIDKDGKNGWIYVGRTGRTYRAPTSDFPEHIKEALIGHGQKQKEKDGTGNLDTEEEMFAYIQKSHEMLAGGTFNGAGGGGFAFDSDLVAVLVAMTKQPEADVKKMLKDCSAAEREVLKQQPDIKKAIEDRVAKRTENVKSEDVLKKFGLNIIGG